MTRRPLIALDLGGVLVEVDHDATSHLGDERVRAEAFFGAGRHDALTVGTLGADAYIAAAAAALGVHVDDAAQAWARVVSWLPGATRFVSALLRHADVVIWSNTDPWHWGSLAGALPVGAQGLKRALSFELGAAKPDPLFFARAVARAGRRPNLFLDDRPDNVEGARAADVPAARVCGLEEARAALFAHGISLSPAAL
jgi:FMN phosphatase YigB (HAD superfamily)